MKLPYLDIVVKYIDEWYKEGWLLYGIIGLSIFIVYAIVRVLTQ